MVNHEKTPISFNSLFLAAGFGTRLGEFGEKLPKGLIPSGETTILDHLIKDLKQIKNVDVVALVTNNRFFNQYDNWLKARGLGQWVQVLNDGVNQPQNRRGAIGDFIFALDELDLGSKDVLVLPSDTVYKFSLIDFVTFTQSCPNDSLITVVGSTKVEKIKNRLGCVVLEGSRVVEFVEKPEQPKTNYAGFPFYFYKQAVLEKVRQYYQLYNQLETQDLLDSPGKIIPWLIEQQVPVFGFVTEAEALDIGTQADLQDAKDFC